MSKADKMRGRLASIQKDREDFERQKKELEADMSVGRHNMSKINKGLRNNAILEEPIVVETHKTHNHHPHHNSKLHNGRDTHHNGANASGAPLTPKHGQHHSESNLAGSQNLSNSSTTHTLGAGAMGVTGSGNPTNQLNIMPSGPRVSDWCYSAPLDSPAPPQVKSRELYENVRLLGRGSFGEVSLVKNVEDNKLFAIKTQLCPKDSEFHNVLREVRFLRTCRHPCIIDVHDAFLITNPRIVYIVMHYCESGTISSVITSARKNKSTLAESQVVKWTLQLALAMQYLHDNHVVHRDLKPMNVMLTEGGDSLKLADFGLAMSMAEKDEEENTDEAGTPYYTAPEMIQREPYSYPADCWSFGVIVHQLLALERPFDGSSTGDLVKSILSGEIPALPVHYSDDIKLISRELLRKDQTERLTMTEILLEPMFYSKLAAFPQSYRPRTLEERIRRAHQKQLECQMEALNRARRAEGYRSLHERVALRAQAEEAALALSGAGMTDTLTSTAATADTPTGTTSNAAGSGVVSGDVSPAKNSISRNSSNVNTFANTRDSTPNTTTPTHPSNTNNTTNTNTTTHNNNTNISSNPNLRRHTETPTMLSDELNTNSYIRTSRSNVEDVLHPADNLPFSPVERGGGVYSGNSSPTSDLNTSTNNTSNIVNSTNTSTNSNNNSNNNISKLESVAEGGSGHNSIRIDTTSATAITDTMNSVDVHSTDVHSVKSVSSVSSIVPHVAYTDSMDSPIAQNRSTREAVGGTVDTNANNTSSITSNKHTTNTATTAASNKYTIDTDITTDDTDNNTADTTNNTNANNTADTTNNTDNTTNNTIANNTADTTNNTNTTTNDTASRPTTPHGGRKGQELQRAIEHDQFYALSEQEVTVLSVNGTSDSTSGRTGGSASSNNVNNAITRPDSPNTRIHSFESKIVLEKNASDTSV